MRHIILLSLVTMTACMVGSTPPPPQLKVTSPDRAMVQSDAGQVVVKGVAQPGTDGSPIVKVTVNKVPAMLAADGSFTATVDVPAGATLLETVAITDQGGAATDARAVEVGQLRPVGTSIDRAVTAALSADAFARLSAAAGPLVKSMNLAAMLAPLQPMATLGDDIANLRLSITSLTLGDVKLSLAPVDGGLSFSAELDGLSVAARADYAGTLVVDGTTQISMTAQQVTIAGTLVVTPAGTAGFTTTIASPTIRTAGLHLSADGLTGQLVDRLQSQLDSTIQSFAQQTAQTALTPLINQALGALGGPQSIDVLGNKLDLQASPSAVTFTSAGALVTMNLAAKLEGSESSPGYIFTPNGTPALDVSQGVQLALADDLINELLAEVHQLGLLDIKLDQDFGPFDGAEIKLTVPPMITANTDDGAMRLVLGDMVVTLSDHGKPAVSAAINASVDLAIVRGSTSQEIALQFGKVDLFVNLLGDSTDGGDSALGAATTGINLQLSSLSQFLITVPVPSVAGVTLDNLALRGDSGYVVVSGQVH